MFAISTPLVGHRHADGYLFKRGQRLKLFILVRLCAGFLRLFLGQLFLVLGQLQ